MKDLIINSLELLCKIGMFLLVSAGLGFGIMTGNPYVTAAAVLVAFVVGTLVFGVLFLLIDISDNIRAVRYALEKHEKS